MNRKGKAIVEFYKKLHGKDPVGLKDWEIAKDIIEVFGQRNFLDAESQSQQQWCEHEIRYVIDYPDGEMKAGIIMDMEDFIGSSVQMQ